MACHNCPTSIRKRGSCRLQMAEMSNAKAHYECFAFRAIPGTVLIWFPQTTKQEENPCFMSLNTIPGQQRREKREYIREEGNVNSRNCLTKLVTASQNIASYLAMQRGLITSCQGEEAYAFKSWILLVPFLSLKKVHSIVH